MAELEQNYEQLKQAQQTLDVARAQMDKLAAKGDNVTIEDLVKVAGRLVARGLDPTAMASMLADAPQENNGLLAEWVKKQDVELTQREQHLKLVMRSTRFQLGMKGIGMVKAGMGMNALTGGGGAPPGPVGPAGPNALMPATTQVLPAPQDTLGQGGGNG